MKANKSFERIAGGICAPQGFSAGAISAGVKPGGVRRRDFALIASEKPCVAAGTFTTNKVKAAPVRLSMEHLDLSTRPRAVVLNSGNANACTGERGMRDAVAIAAAVAQVLGVAKEDVLVCSTGRIGVYLPVHEMVAAVPELVESLGENGSSEVAEAIMTSDTVMKEVGLECHSKTSTVFRVGGIAKGAGMIDPNMATMLCVVTTDARFSKDVLQACLSKAVEHSFNRITVDGDMSTNDTVILLSSGLVEGAVAVDDFQAALNEVCLDLAQKIVLDGEGVTRFIEVSVVGAKSNADARKAAEAVANSTLAKCAWAGGDPNWGRILDAVGYSGANVQEEVAAIDYDGIYAFRAGEPVEGVFEALQAVVAKKAFKVTVHLNLGKGNYSVFTTDLTEEYVRLNLGE